MAISTNSVIHYTDRIDHLQGIISSRGFKLKYCSEELYLQSSTQNFDAAFPMISFCDIPLSEIKNHIDTYGAYGIGLTKNWAKSIGLNPVLYIEKQSKLALSLDKQGERIYGLMKSNKMDFELTEEFFDFISYCKNYEGRLVRGKINTDTYRFYDEREWRYIASSEDLKEEFPVIMGDTYRKDKQAFNDKIKDCLINFSFSDISYIIVDNEDEIPDILKTLNDSFEDLVTAKELKILSTKIITKNQIWNDF